MSSSPQMALPAGGLLIAVTPFTGLPNQGVSFQGVLSAEDAAAGPSLFQLELRLRDSSEFPMVTEAFRGRAATPVQVNFAGLARPALSHARAELQLPDGPLREESPGGQPDPRIQNQAAPPALPDAVAVAAPVAPAPERSSPLPSPPSPTEGKRTGHLFPEIRHRQPGAFPAERMPDTPAPPAVSLVAAAPAQPDPDGAEGLEQPGGKTDSAAARPAVAPGHILRPSSPLRATDLVSRGPAANQSESSAPLGFAAGVPPGHTDEDMVTNMASTNGRAPAAEQAARRQEASGVPLAAAAAPAPIRRNQAVPLAPALWQVPAASMNPAQSAAPARPPRDGAAGAEQPGGKTDSTAARPAPAPEQLVRPSSLLPAPDLASRETTTNPSGSSAPLAFAARLSPGHTEENPVTPTPSQNDATPESSPATPAKMPAQPGRYAAAPRLLEETKSPDGKKLPGAPAERPAKTDFVPVHVDYKGGDPQPRAGSSAAATSVPPNLGAANEPGLKPDTPSSLRDFRVSLSDERGGATEVRFQNAGGEIRVSVRTPDSGLAQTLRGGLEELSLRLGGPGIQSEVWRPGAELSFQQNDSSHPSLDPNQSGSDGNGSPKGRRDHPQQDQPRWLQEMEASIGVTPE